MENLANLIIKAGNNKGNKKFRDEFAPYHPSRDEWLIIYNEAKLVLAKREGIDGLNKQATI